MSLYAAVDIGSNTIRMDVAEAAPGARLKVISSDRTFARIGESVFTTGAVSEEAIGRACAILSRLAVARPPRTRAVATAALREAANRDEFVERASAALGISVEVIPGEEEARLIQLGVRSFLPDIVEKPLIIDVGGGSTEVIFGAQMWSLPLGALRLKTMFLHHDPPAPEELDALFRHIGEKSAPVIEALRKETIEQVIGTSATARIMAPTDVPQFFKVLCALDLAAREKIETIGPNRAEIIVPGAAVLVYLLDALKLSGMTYSPAALCAGVIADLAASGI